MRRTVLALALVSACERAPASKTTPAAAPSPNTPSPTTKPSGASAPGGPSDTRSTTWEFDSLPSNAITNAASAWAVIDDAAAVSPPRIVRGEGTADASKYKALLVGRFDAADVNVEVQVRARTGERDQGGGVVWRARDVDNHYIARWNPLESNVRLYVMHSGTRVALRAAEVEAPTHQWHSLRVEHRGTTIRVFFDDRPLFETQDPTFVEPGHVGLWFKLDAGTDFDDLAVSAL